MRFDNRIAGKQSSQTETTQHTRPKSGKSLPPVPVLKQPGNGALQAKRSIEKQTPEGNTKQSLLNTKDNAVVQRYIVVGKDAYFEDDGYQFRRQLMLSLKQNKFKELGSKKMWSATTDWLASEEKISFRGGWDELIAYLWDHSYLDKIVRYGSMGPKNLGTRPSFTSETTEAVKIEEGEHRRHIISSSSLGLAIEKSGEALKQSNNDRNARINILNEWLQRNGGSNQKSEHQAMMAIWKIVHNHTGNLWAGPGNYNSAIGFIRPAIQKLIQKIEDNPVEVNKLKQEIADLKPAMGWIANQWNEILAVLDETISMIDPKITAIGAANAYLKWQDELKAAMGKGFEYSAQDLADRMYKKLDDATGINGLSMTEAIDVINMWFNTKKFVFYKRYKPIIIKWINVYSYGKDIITAQQAKSVIADWVANCDLDYPYGKDKGEEYNKELMAIYKSLFTPDDKLFDSGGILDRFMLLNV